MASPSIPRQEPHIPRGGVTRVLPFGSRHSVHILERNRFIFRRGWMVIFSGFFEPVFFLLGIGFGLGSLIGTVAGPDGTQIPYAVFVAPALLATASMNGAVYDTTNMFFRLRYEKAYDGIRPISIDHAVMEAAARDGRVVMAAMDVGWSDDPEESFKIFQGKILEEYDRMVSEFGLTVIDASRSIERQQREMRLLIGQHLNTKKRRGQGY